ncbi:alpha/beta hydrolase family protein [Streptomyces buecherae]|uniref:Alpha/beta hydrolase n=1 Tax=Streptomyces buecherae TaxID=2763006 RepID=A0A7H8NAM4_9ACTN|nr:alpha/beta hydrolase [Streptomyces buecherae]QKW51432.1 alpha/beta hydrolase [Streptomyces buecherae]
MNPAMTRAEREEASAFGHAEAPPTATVGYGPHPDQVVDLFLPESRAVPGFPAGSESRAGAEPRDGGVAPPAGAAARVIADSAPPAPGAAPPVPLVVLFHGGAWRAPYDRRHLSPLAAYLAGHGLAVASVEYRRGPLADGPAASAAGPGQPRAGRWPETFDDIAAALDALPALVRGLAAGPAGPAVGGASAPAVGGSPGPAAGRVRWADVDADRPVLVGHSAGGHAVLWAAARHRLPVGSRWRLPAPPALRGVVGLAAIADFGTARALGVCSHAVDQLLAPQHPPATPGPGPAEHAALLAHRLACTDPSALVPNGVPTTLVQGGADIDVPPAVAEAFVTAAARAGQRVRLVRVEGVGHFPPIDPATTTARTVLAEITRLT